MKFEKLISIHQFFIVKNFQKNNQLQ